jgi:hypothetical protein
MPHTIKLPGTTGLVEAGQLVKAELTAQELLALAEEETKKALALKKAEKVAAMKAQITKTAQVKHDLVSYGKAHGLTEAEAKAQAKALGSAVSHGKLSLEQAYAKIEASGTAAKEAAKQAWVDAMKTYEGVPTWVTHKLVDLEGVDALAALSAEDLNRELLLRMIQQGGQEAGLAEEAKALWWEKWKVFATKDVLSDPKLWANIVDEAKLWKAAEEAKALGVLADLEALHAAAAYFRAVAPDMTVGEIATNLHLADGLRNEFGFTQAQAREAQTSGFKAKLQAISDKYGLEYEDLAAGAKEALDEGGASLTSKALLEKMEAKVVSSLEGLGMTLKDLEAEAKTIEAGPGPTVLKAHPPKGPTMATLKKSFDEAGIKWSLEKTYEDATKALQYMAKMGEKPAATAKKLAQLVGTDAHRTQLVIKAMLQTKTPVTWADFEALVKGSKGFPDLLEDLAAKKAALKAGVAPAIKVGEKFVAEGKTWTVAAKIPPTTPTKFSTEGWTLVDANPKLGGAFKKEIWKDPQGQEWLFKPIEKAGDLKKIYADEAVSKLGKLIVPEGTVEARVATLNGVEGSVQRLLPGAKDLPDLGTLSAAQRAEIQQQQVLDWLVGNHDSHAGQWLVREDGTIVGIDKSQAFKYYGKDALSPTYHPNAAFGEKPPIYNLLAEKAQKGALYDPYAVTPALERAMAIPDEVLRDILTPYAKARFGADTNAIEEFIGQVISRKNNLKTSFEGYYGTITKKTVAFKLGPPAAAAPAAADAKVGMTAKEWTKKEFQKAGVKWSDEYAAPTKFEKWYEGGYNGKPGYKALAEDGSSHFFPGLPPPQLGAPTLEQWKADKALQAKLEAEVAEKKAAQAKTIAQKNAAVEAAAKAEAEKVAGEIAGKNLDEAYAAVRAFPTQDMGKIADGLKGTFWKTYNALLKYEQAAAKSLSAQLAKILPDGTRWQIYVSHGDVQSARSLLAGELRKLGGLTVEAADHAMNAARSYTNGLYNGLNRWLRGKLSSDDLWNGARYSEWAKRLDTFIKHSVGYRRDIPLWRGASIAPEEAAKFIAGTKKVYTDPAFASCGTAPDYGNKWGSNLLIEYLPGSKRSATAVDALSANLGEMEAIYARGIQFRVHTFREITPLERQLWGLYPDRKWLLVIEEV